MREPDTASPSSPGRWFERGGRLALGLYFSIPCVVWLGVAILRAWRGDVGVLLPLGVAVVSAIGAIQVWRGRFLLPAVYLMFEFAYSVVNRVIGSSGRGPSIWLVLANWAFCAVAIAWIVARRHESAVSSERVRGTLSALLAATFLGWTVPFGVAVGNGLGAVLVREPRVKPAITLVKGARVPRAHFLDASGAVEDLQSEGIVYVVNFWATWCPPCVEELPHLQSLMEEVPRDGRVRFLAVNTEDLDRAAVDSFAREHGLDRLPIYLDPFSSRDAFDVTGIPVTLVIKDGIVLARHDGYRRRRTISALRSLLTREIGP
jgi:thiol-disulfide isomerase/thioredoxin